MFICLNGLPFEVNNNNNNNNNLQIKNGCRFQNGGTKLKLCEKNAKPDVLYHAILNKLWFQICTLDIFKFKMTTSYQK